MKEIIVKCDRCNKPSKEAVELSLSVGKEPHPSGNGYDYDYKDFDICHDCLESILEIAIERGYIDDKLNFHDGP